MSFSLKREIEFYINDTDSTDGVTKLAILPEFELKLEANLIQVYRKIIGEDPEMLPRSAVDQISPISLGFITYLKPSFLDGKVGVTAPEKILYDSLGGILGYRGAEYYKVQFGKVNRLIPLYMFIKTTTAVYKINTAYVDSLEISFDINYLLTGKWTAQGISLDVYSSDEITFTNVKDYTNNTNLIRNKFAITTITDYDNKRTYKLPITKSTIKIVNSLMPVFDKNIKVVTGVPKDLIVTGRAVSGELSSYLSSRIDHSKEFLENVYNDLTTVNRKFKVQYYIEDGDNAFEITLPHAIVNLPNLDFEDVLNTTIQFTSSESQYGLNNDLDFRYYKKLSNTGTYEDYIKYRINPEYYYKFNEIPNTTLINYGTKGNTFNLTRTGTAPTTNLTGPYINSKAWSFNSTYCGTASVKDPWDDLFISFWYKPTTVNANEWLFLYQSDIYDFNVRLLISRAASISGGGYRGIYFDIGVNQHKFDLSTTGTWNHIVVYLKQSTGKIIVYCNNVKKIDSSWTKGSIAGDGLNFGISGGNGLSNSYFSESVISYNILQNEVADVVNTLYNITDTSQIVNDIVPSISDYNDTIINLRGQSEDYVKAIKLFNPKAYWRFNDNDSNTVRDHVLGKYPLTLQNRPQLKLTGPLINDETSKAVWFNILSTGSYQSTVSSSPISTTGITKNTYIFWIYIENDFSPDSNYKHCLLKTGSNTGAVFALLHRSGGFGKSYINNKLYYNYDIGYNDGSYDCAYPFNVLFGIPLNEWVCLAYACNKTNNTIKIYRNGVYQGVVNSSNVGSWWPSTIALEVGKRTYSPRPTFLLSEFAYFEKELSETAIQGIYASSGITGFNIVVAPTKYSYNISGNIPKILIGNNVNPNSGAIAIHCKSSNVGTISYVYPYVGNNLIIEYWDDENNKYENTPIISIAYKFNIIKGNINLNGNTPSINIVKFINPLSGNILISGSLPLFTRYCTASTKHINIFSRIPKVEVKNVINVQTGSLAIHNYSIDVSIIESTLARDIYLVVLI